MSTSDRPKRAVTPPKGRPTRSRHDLAPPRRALGSATQWTLVVVLLAVVFALLVVLFG
jgi:hypothetical protein